VALGRALRKSQMTREGPELGALLEAMRDPAFYEHSPGSVELHETHISWVFVAGELAYKLKKPLRLPFLDYGTLDRRRHMCHEEVRLNRRLAPDYYLGVRAIVPRSTPVEGPPGYSLGAEDDPDAIEFAVEMRAIPEERTLDRLVLGGRLGPEQIEAIAERLAAFHDGAPQVADADAAVERQLAALEENLETTRACAGGLLPAARLEAAERFTSAFLTAGGLEELRARAAAGLVRDCHGDLRAEHVLLTDPVQVYDCVEFDPGLREVDVAADLAFLTMDLERLGGRDLADRLEAAYRDAGGEPGSPRLLAFLASYRAWVRAKVALLDPGQSRDERARELHALGHRLAWRARLPFALVVCGIAASGKSTLAGALAELSGLPVVDADSTRKRLAGLAPSERASPESYSHEFNTGTYRELGAAAASELALGRGVIIDATARRRADRDALREGLGGHPGPLLYARCEAPEAILLARARERERDPHRLSDADTRVVREQIGSFEPLEADETRTAVIDTEEGIDEQIAAVEALLDRGALGR
jgi:aminoglycoside phosphotransferase family enzyme/predicted kinase